jgi:fatty-acyl-CoA synthase
MIERIMGMGVTVKHLWGMTETSPIGTAGFPPPHWEEMTHDAQLDHVGKQGQIPFGIELQVVNDEGVVLPRDGLSSGRLQVRGPWVVKRYFRAEADAVDADQWFDTGDVAVLHTDGTMQITDRAKDVIKSGGEWISSIDLENAAMGHPGVAEAAVIGIAHPKWQERPLLVVVRKAGQDVSRDGLLAFLEGRVAKWWLPDDVAFVTELPHTATGKLLKLKLRETFKDYQLPERP